MDKECLFCKNVFVISSINKQQLARKYCSISCYKKSMVGRVVTWGKKISESKMGHGWPDGFRERQSKAQKKRFMTESPWNKGMLLLEKYGGEKSYNWKGGGVSKKALHSWIRRRLIKSKVCEFCSKEGKLELSNKSQNYLRDLSDWQWLCAKCHRNYDKNSNKAWKTRRKNGTDGFYGNQYTKQKI